MTDLQKALLENKKNKSAEEASGLSLPSVETGEQTAVSPVESKKGVLAGALAKAAEKTQQAKSELEAQKKDNHDRYHERQEAAKYAVATATEKAEAMESLRQTAENIDTTPASFEGISSAIDTLKKLTGSYSEASRYDEAYNEKIEEAKNFSETLKGSLDTYNAEKAKLDAAKAGIDRLDAQIEVYRSIVATGGAGAEKAFADLTKAVNLRNSAVDQYNAALESAKAEADNFLTQNEHYIGLLSEAEKNKKSYNSIVKYMAGGYSSADYSPESVGKDKEVISEADGKIASLTKERDELQAKLDRLTNGNDRGSAQYLYAEEYNKLKEINGQISYYTSEKNKAEKKIDAGNIVRDVAERDDFLEYVKKGMEDIEQSEIGKRVGGGAVAGITNAKAQEYIAVLEATGNLPEGSTDQFQNYDDSKNAVYDPKYKYMTNLEVEVYAYLRAKEKEGLVEAGSSHAFLETLKDTISERVNDEYFNQKLKGNTALEYLYGIEAGLDQYVSGIRGLFGDTFPKFCLSSVL